MRRWHSGLVLWVHGYDGEFGRARWCGRGSQVRFRGLQMVWFQLGLKWCGRRSQVSLEWVTEGSRWLRFCGRFFASSVGGKDSSLPGLVAGVARFGFFFFFFLVVLICRDVVLGDSDL